MPDTIVAQLTGAALALAPGARVAGAEEAKLQLMFVQCAAGFTAPQALYFSDRPERVAGHISMDDYLSYWREGADNFGEASPCAATAQHSDVEATAI